MNIQLQLNVHKATNEISLVSVINMIGKLRSYYLIDAMRIETSY